MCIQWHPIQLLHVMDQCEVGKYNVHYNLLATMCILHYVAKHGCDYHDSIIRTEIHLKTRYHAILVSTFVI